MQDVFCSLSIYEVFRNPWKMWVLNSSSTGQTDMPVTVWLLALTHEIALKSSQGVWKRGKWREDRGGERREVSGEGRGKIQTSGVQRMKHREEWWVEWVVKCPSNTPWLSCSTLPYTGLPLNEGQMASYSTPSDITQRNLFTLKPIHQGCKESLETGERGGGRGEWGVQRNTEELKTATDLMTLRYDN